MTSAEDAARAAPAPRPRRLIAPMSPASVPAVDARYWVAISLASVAGCNMGDLVSLYLHLGHWLGLIPLAALFAALIFGQRRARRPSEAWYWAAILTLRTAATNLADLATHTFGLEYAWVIAALEALQVLAVLRVAPRPPGGRRPVVDGWYWAAMLTAGTLGTAIGDGVAESLRLGTGVGTLALSAALLAVLALGARGGWRTRAAYWLAIVAVRSAGTTAGDFIAYHDGGVGLGWGLPLSTAVTTAAFVGVLAAWRPSSGARADHT